MANQYEIEEYSTIIVEGNIGAGKTTLLKNLEDIPNTKILYEPIEKWQNLEGSNMLNLFYDNPKKYAFQFQSYVSQTMVQQLFENKRDNPPNYRITERSLFSQYYCFAKLQYNKGNISDTEYSVLKTWNDYYKEYYECGKLLAIYLRTKPEVAYSRCNKRNRSEERKISLEYLTELHNLHEEWLNPKKCEIPIMIIDGNQSIEEMEMDIKNLKNILTNSIICQAGDLLRKRQRRP